MLFDSLAYRFLQLETKLQNAALVRFAVSLIEQNSIDASTNSRFLKNLSNEIVDLNDLNSMVLTLEVLRMVYLSSAL